MSRIPFARVCLSEEEEEEVVACLRSGWLATGPRVSQFESAFADFVQCEDAVAVTSGTAALQLALMALDFKEGDEVITPSMTWVSLPNLVRLMGGHPVFCDIDSQTLNMHIGHAAELITERTKAIVPVHYSGYPTDMDPLMEIAGKHGLKVVEDVSHAQGGLYKGRLLGTIGDVGAMSIMSGKSLACGEGGFLVTDDDDIFERAAAFGHYERIPGLENPDFNHLKGMPIGGYKYRMHQLSSAMGRVQLRHYDVRVAEIQRAMNHFWDQLEGVPGIRPHRPAADSGSTMGGWYAAKGLYVAEELGDLPVARFCDAVNAEIEGSGCQLRPGANTLMHTHPMLNDYDVFGDGKPTRIAFSDRDLRQPAGSLPVTETLPERCYSIPWFKHHRPAIIDRFVEAFRKVAENADRLC